MASKIIGGAVKLWTYRAVGVVPPNLPLDQPHFLEGAVRGAVNWNDTMLSWIRGTDVLQETITDQEMQALMADFQARLSSH